MPLPPAAAGLVGRHACEPLSVSAHCLLQYTAAGQAATAIARDMLRRDENRKRSVQAAYEACNSRQGR